jgi:AbrB family looped-hinge helix DNA binding protein
MYIPAMVVPTGLEPATFGLGNRCSIRLSYGTRLFHRLMVSAAPSSQCSGAEMPWPLRQRQSIPHGAPRSAEDGRFPWWWPFDRAPQPYYETTKLVISQGAELDATENRLMALMRVRRLAQLTLPAEVRRALNVKEGDYLEAHIVKDGVLLKPVSVVERERAWKGIMHAMSQVRDLEAKPREDNQVEEERIAKMVKESRRKKRKHA